MTKNIILVVMVVQFIFAGALVVLGLRGRDERRLVFLTLSNRVAAGKAGAEDLVMLAEFLPKSPDRATVREVFGPPIKRATSVSVVREKPETLIGEFWLYYPKDAQGQPLDFAAVSALKEPTECFLVEFDGKGNTRTGLVKVVHPVAE